MNALTAASFLGVDTDATSEEVNRAFKRYAQMFHPDKRPNDPDAHRRMTMAVEARSILLESSASSLSRPSRETTRRSQKARSHAKARSNEDLNETSRYRRLPWPAPLTAESRFFAERGFVLRPTDGRMSFRLFVRGDHRHTLVRHPENWNVLYCRDAAGSVADIGGIRWWIDDGVGVEPL